MKTPTQTTVVDFPNMSGFFSLWGKGGWNIYFGENLKDAKLIGITESTEVERSIISACRIGYDEGKGLDKSQD